VAAQLRDLALQPFGRQRRELLIAGHPRPLP
jgi:hypothetical protein